MCEIQTVDMYVVPHLISSPDAQPDVWSSNSVTVVPNLLVAHIMPVLANSHTT